MICKSFSLALLFLLVQNANSQDTLLVNFQFDKFDVSPLEKDKIKRFSEKHQESTFYFIGFTDTIGSIEYNKVLAKNRVLSVRELVLGAVPESNNSVVGETSQFKILGKNRAVQIIASSPAIEIEIPSAASPLSIQKDILDTLRLKVEFWGGTPDVKDYSYPELYTLYNKIKEATDVNVEIHGHVCCADDMDLSIARARRVRDWLILKGIDENRLTYQGHSNYLPRVPEISEENNQLNRRVEVVLYRKLN
ncbi:MAG: OmpA family protein [Bacteroidota bacterium]